MLLTVVFEERAHLASERLVASACAAYELRPLLCLARNCNVVDALDVTRSEADIRRSWTDRGEPF